MVRHPSHQNNILPPFLLSLSPHPAADPLFFFCSIFSTLSPEPSTSPGGIPLPSLTVTDPGAPPPHSPLHLRHHLYPSSPALSVGSASMLSNTPSECQPPAALRERKREREKTEESCLFNEGMILDRADSKKGGHLGSDKTPANLANDLHLSSECLHISTLPQSSPPPRYPQVKVLVCLCLSATVRWGRDAPSAVSPGANIRPPPLVITAVTATCQAV